MEAHVVVVLDAKVVFDESITVGDINASWTREQYEREWRREAWRAVLEDGKAKPEDEARAVFQIS